MFPQDTNAEKKTLVFIGAFHFGISLAMCQTDKSQGWINVCQELAECFSAHTDRFEVLSLKYESDILFPLGNPLILKRRNFFKLFNMSRLFSNAGFYLSTGQYEMDSMVWICPSGVVLILAKIGFLNILDKSLLQDIDINGATQACLLDLPSKRVHNASNISLIDFEDEIVEDHYAELGYIFTEFAEVILSVIPVEFLNSSICCASDIEKIKKVIEWRKSRLELETEDIPDLTELFLKNREFQTICQDVLVDVYYIEFALAASEYTKLQIGYVDSTVKSHDRSYLIYISIAFSTFVGLLWLIKHLGEQSRILSNYIDGYSILRREFSLELKQFRIFCLQFINESSPIQVRLTRKYMECIEEYWKESRVPLLVSQINEQLAVLEQMGNWLEEINRETRNFKIGVAAVLLAIISTTAVAAQLISTIDVNSQLGVFERSALVFIGLIIGILCTVGMYILPFTRRFALHKKRLLKDRRKK